MTPNSELKQNALEVLDGKWGTAALTTFVYMIIVGAPGLIPILGTIGTLIIAGPMALGYTLFSISLSRKEEASLNQLFDGFKKFEKALGTYLLMVLFTMIGFLLLIIPGIIVAIGLSQAFFIIAEDENIGAVDALKKSWDMMNGYKSKYFLLILSFIGWVLLCILTFGIGFFWLTPYIQVSMVNFYEDIKNNPIS